MESEENWDLHPELAALLRFLQAISKHYEDMGRRLKDEVWSKKLVHSVLQFDEMTVQLQAGHDTAFCKVSLPDPAPSDVSIANGS
eukprot:5120890-Amphidinium_carterae.2